MVLYTEFPHPVKRLLGIVALCSKIIDMMGPKYLYLLAIPTQLTELASAESLALTGNAPNEYGITVSETYVDVSRGAYLKSCSELLFEAGSISELYSSVRRADFHAEGFRVSVVKKPRSLDINGTALASEIGSLIAGKPNLSSPRVVFMTVVTAEKIWFGRLLSKSDGMWLTFDQRPHVTSSSLPARLARALVNLVVSPGQNLLDPCCGTGTIVMSAAHCGVRATGYDINPRMVGATSKNLAFYGLNADVKLEDARLIREKFDAVATDLPYGISLVKDSTAMKNILTNLRTCAPIAGFIDIRDLSQQLEDLGYVVENVIPVPKQRLVRRIFITSVNNQ